MATIKAIESRSVHQIQSGQVIVDLCSVVKELVENSLDAGATSVDVRFKGHGLEAIEVQDNGGGICSEDYETIGLKHYTSKLSSYDDLGSLNTFGFRGEALSSLCALSKFHIITAQENEAPRGKRLDFEVSGQLKDTSVTACQKGTTVAVEDLFYNLPVRRRELEKNIKREYGKVLGILHAYACISIGVRFSVSNQVTKGKKAVVFATKSNQTTKENIANVYGAKTVTALIPLNLELELQPSTSLTQILKEPDTDANSEAQAVRIIGHISKPVFGDGRQTPDRQLFFVNGRPCGLPQIAKAFNEVYKSYNVTQSPFVFADLRMNTNSYDVNVSPDKRTILLHNQNALLERLKSSLTSLFEAQDQTVPQSQLVLQKLPKFRPLTLTREVSGGSAAGKLPKPVSDGTRLTPTITENSSPSAESQDQGGVPIDLIQQNISRDLIDRDDVPKPRVRRTNEPLVREKTPKIVQDFNDRLASQRAKSGQNDIVPDSTDGRIPVITTSSRSTVPGIVQLAHDRSRPRRVDQEVAVITVGDKVSSTLIGGSAAKRPRIEGRFISKSLPKPTQPSQFAQSLRVFAASGTQVKVDEDDDEDEDEATAAELVDMHRQTSSRGNSVLKDQFEEHDDNLDTPSPSCINPASEFDDEYVDEEERQRRDQDQIEKMVRQAEDAAAQPIDDSRKKASLLLRTSLRNDSTISLVRSIETSVLQIDEQLKQRNNLLQHIQRTSESSQQQRIQDPAEPDTSAEERLSLTISKSDFSKMHIVGQFNLGFILATRPADPSGHPATHKAPSDDLFIIDQHASDEIFNFHRLSACTTLTPQPLVQPHQLHLTVIEEETILEALPTLHKNGFSIAIDDSGASPIGTRCKLLALPTSRETTFDLRDLEELISLLGDTSLSSTHTDVPRPSKVRKMLAMRACRSSIMVGRTLTLSAMRALVAHMGAIDKPWNCPHGRPTMRHLACLGSWKAWREGDGVTVDRDDEEGGDERREVGWGVFMAGRAKGE